MASGCSESDSGNVFKQIFEHNLDYLNYQCQCLVAAGMYASVAECFEVNEIDTSISSEEQCMADELAANETAANVANCQLPLIEELLSCLQDQGCPDPAGFSCNDGSTIASDWVCDGDADCPQGEDELNCEGGGLSCEAVYDNALGGCGVIPDVIYQAADMTCYGSYTCADGSVISGSWQCDGEPDCAGGEDELNCP